MKFSENWLRQLIDIPADHAALVERLTLSGLEVDGVERLGDGLEGVVVGEIIAIEPHPDADRLRVCQVTAGSGEPLTIVCGAPNARLGLKAPLATVGAVLPGGLKIKPAKLRGIESFGMLCSARELALADDADGLMELPAVAAAGQPLAAALKLPDAVIELGLTPNRPDCLGMQGLARDVAAQFGQAYTPSAQTTAEVSSASVRGIRLEAGTDCPRYLGRVIDGLDMAAPTPAWMALRLRRAGLRPLSLVVDVTNYVMLELGQPLHAFDNECLDGDIVVRHARKDEPLALLDGSEATLDESFLVIADDRQALAVAGVMGGHASRVTDDTRTIFLESAHFAPAAIMGRARRLGLHTDASHRFERGVDPELPRQALERASELLLSIAGGQAGPVCVAEHTADLPLRPPVRLRRQRLERVLGLSIDDAAVATILGNLGLQPQAGPDGWQVTPPSWRFDIEREEDLIEEVARIHGYPQIAVRAPSGELVLAPEAETLLPRHQLVRQLIARDYHEAICMAFVSADLLDAWGLAQGGVTLANPLSADQAVMRPSLLPGLVQALRRNRARQQERVRLFESGHVFAAGGEAAPRETAMLALVACGDARREQWGESHRALDFHDLKGDVQSLLAAGDKAWAFDAETLPDWLHPGRAARVLQDGQPVGWLGELHPALAARLGLDEVVLVAELELIAVQQRPLPQAQPVARFPHVRRDLAVEVDASTPWQQIADCVHQAAGERLRELRLFDQYQGPELDPGRKSLAMGLILQARSRTLVDNEVDECVATVVAALSAQCAARLRG